MIKLSRLQKHTIEAYSLEQQPFIEQRIKARALLSQDRFDLYAKLFYIKNRETNRDLAIKVYTEHILAFNPDGKEPGRSDKDGINDFIQVFDELIGEFKENDFDSLISLIPIDKNNNPLDGSHRIAALAYFDKEIEILKFSEVKAKVAFDYEYFFKRGLSAQVSDYMAMEVLNYTTNLHLACLWPKMGNLKEKQFALDYLHQHFTIYYTKSMRMPLEGLTRLIYESYKHQDWVGDYNNNFSGARSKALNCYASHGIVQFVLFRANDLDNVLKAKEVIREHYQLDKHALHITDDDRETKEMMELVFTERAKQFQNASSELKDKIQEFRVILKNVYWINFKVNTARVLKKFKLYN